MSELVRVNNKKKPSIARINCRSEMLCQREAISVGVTSNLRNYLFSDGSSAHFEEGCTRGKVYRRVEE